MRMFKDLKGKEEATENGDMVSFVAVGDMGDRLIGNQETFSKAYEWAMRTGFFDKKPVLDALTEAVDKAGLYE